MTAERRESVREIGSVAFRDSEGRRFTCGDCEWFSYGSPDALYAHVHQVHVNRRIYAVTPNPGRRRDDSQPEWVRRARAGLLPAKHLS